MLVLRRKKGEAIKIGDNITVTVSDIGQDCVQIAIDAPVSYTHLTLPTT